MGMFIGLGLLLVAGREVALSAEGSRPALSGMVKSPAGEALRDATVFIYTAAPKEGVGILCPSCYADCRKRATTDALGEFKIESLDPALLFRILVVAPGHQPEFVTKVDPADGPLYVELKPVSGGSTPDKQMRGKVVDAEGKPVSGAVVSINGVTRGQSTRYGGNTNVDQVAVSDNSGAFVLNSTQPFDAVGVEVEAPLLAKRVFQRLASGGKVHELKLGEGVSIKGRLLKDGKPLGGVQMGVAGADRSSEVFVGDFAVGTDDEGRFLFVNMPARTDFFAYGKMESFGAKGAIVSRRVRGESDGGEVDLGDLNVASSYTLAGRIILTDGKRVPEKTRVMLSRAQAWDQQQAEADADGAFRFEGVPAESVNLSCRVKGYRYTVRNASVDLRNAFRLIGKVTGNITNIILELEPGERTAASSSGPNLENEPLRGAEGGKQGGDIRVTGTVTDKDTGDTIAKFNVTHGREEMSRTRFEWQRTRKETCTNGTFEVFFTKQRYAPAVLVEAEGYLPFASGAITTTETNLSIALKRGKGPSGVVLKPNGEPAAGIKVYMTDMKNNVYVGGERAEVRESMTRDITETRTDDSGRFSFPPQVDAFSLVVIDDVGFMDVRVADVSEDARLKLQPWARVEGKLLVGRQPGTNQPIRLSSAHLPYENEPRSFPPISLHLTTKTDDEGNFLFDRVPPMAAEVYHEPKVRDSRTGIIAQSQTTKLLLKSGETRALTLGGKGRPVIGRVVVNGYDQEINWRNDVFRLETVLPQPEGVPDFLKMSREHNEAVRKLTTDEEKQAAQDEYSQRRKEALERTKAFYASEAGRNYHFSKRRFALNFAQDGSFRVEDVPAGKYSLKIDLRAGNGESAYRMSAPLIGQLEKEIEVPDPGKEWSDEPFDLGKLEIDARPTLTKGKAAPDFETKTLDDKTIKLSDFRGKYVLLDFWAVWCGPCIAETPHLKEAYDAFKTDSRFAMIGLSLDPDIAAPRKYAEKNSLGWIQGFLGEWAKTDVPKRFGVEGIPSIFLIGPDGNVIASGLRGANIKSAVASALKTPTARK